MQRKKREEYPNTNEVFVDYNFIEKILMLAGFDNVVVFFRALKNPNVTNVQGHHESGHNDLPLTQHDYD